MISDFWGYHVVFSVWNLDMFMWLALSAVPIDRLFAVICYWSKYRSKMSILSTGNLDLIKSGEVCDFSDHHPPPIHACGTIEGRLYRSWGSGRSSTQPNLCGSAVAPPTCWPGNGHGKGQPDRVREMSRIRVWSTFACFRVNKQLRGIFDPLRLLRVKETYQVNDAIICHIFSLT